ncbi:regulatory solute carrier protein family 1 member 1 [Ochotona curzoniae]|uniref:regulatory solute carrier protein family 1 member 1 n=1 Tax=Ochotona curzoniae TaxID=130825 RepID=UPI001B34E36B|nr:regulatory solute carrier protein family 1 member 1 [Ochotona curzoniae]
MGMSSLPTLDGFNRPARSAGQSPEIGQPTSLAPSVSAPDCPLEPGNPDGIEPKAVPAWEASAEFQMNSKNKDHFPVQDHSGHASSADQSSVMPAQNSSEAAAVGRNLEVSADTQGLRCHLHTRQEAHLSLTTTRTFLGSKGWHPENQNLSPVNDLQHHQEPENQQFEVAHQNAPCDRGNLELPGERQQKQEAANVETTMKGVELQQVDLPDTGESFLPSECFGHSNSETIMEIDIVEQSLVTVLNSTHSQNANVRNVSASDLALDNPLMEVELSKCNPSSEMLNNSFSIQDLEPPEGNVEMSGTHKECGRCAPSSTVCDHSQPSLESTEESCSSVTTALKELHELLVISSKPASETTFEEVVCQSERTAEGQTGIDGLSERWTQNEHLRCQDEESPQILHETISVSGKTEKLTGTSPGAGIEDRENTNFQGLGGGLSADEGDPKSRKSVGENRSVTLTSPETFTQLDCTASIGITGEEDTPSQTCEQAKALPSSFVLVKDLCQGIQNPITNRPETRENVCPEAARPVFDFDSPTSHSSAGPAVLPPFVFPAADIDRILRAGFTLQEALGALHRVGGNADLALLVLLAKNIVVPT